MMNVEKVLRDGTRAAFRRCKERGLSHDQVVEKIELNRRKIDALFEGEPSEDVVLTCFYEAVALCSRNKALHQ